MISHLFGRCCVRPSCIRGRGRNLPMEQSLAAAAEAGDLQAVQSLLDRRADVNSGEASLSPSCHGGSALILASRAGHDDVVRHLLKVDDIDVDATSADTNNYTRCNQTALHWAARGGHLSVVKELAADSRVNLEAATKIGFTPLEIAAQAGHLAVVNELLDRGANPAHMHLEDSIIEFSALRNALIENQPEVVEVLLKTGAIDVNRPYKDLLGPNSTFLQMAVVHHMPGVVRVLLEYNADPKATDDEGRSALMLAVMENNPEMILSFMQGDPDTGVFTKVRQAQILGDAEELRQLLDLEEQESCHPSDIVPLLHLATLQGDVKALDREIQRLGRKSAMNLADGGFLPASYYAVEIGDKDIVHMILKEGHGLGQHIIDVIDDFERTSPLDRGTSLLPGARTFRATCAMLGEKAVVCEDHNMAKGAFAFLKPWCGSVSTLAYFQKRPEDFQLLRLLCKERCTEIYDRIDQEVSFDTLARLAEVGASEYHEKVRQDDEGLVPELKYYLDGDNGGKLRGGNSETFVARSLALLAQGLDKVFQEDVRNLFAGSDVEIHLAPPKTYTRMFNKLNNPYEHGDPSLQRPRPSHNIDLMRFAAVCDQPEDLQKVLGLMRKYHILRVKNNHDPHTDGGFGGYRNILVNFAYESGLTYGEIFGDTGKLDWQAVKAGNTNNVITAEDEKGIAWLDFAHTLGRQATDWSWGLMPLWRIARLEPDRQVVMSAEVQIIYRPYSWGRSLSHLLYKISRCETAAELARDFSREEFFTPSEEQISKREEARELAVQARRGKQLGASAAAFVSG